MPVLTDKEADALDEMLTKITPGTNPDVWGPFIKNRERLIVLDTFSAEYPKAKMMAANKTQAELINGMIHREMALAE
jgi:F420-dependent methylenetetrahydromethanopterin dehydrogenase